MEDTIKRTIGVRWNVILNLYRDVIKSNQFISI